MRAATSQKVPDFQISQINDLQHFIFTRFDTLDSALTRFDNENYRLGIRDLGEIWKVVSAAGYNDGRIMIVPSVVRGLEYYTGPVFEAELTFEINDEKGRPVRFGSVGGGGRYDGLVSRFRGEPVPATGFSIGVSRLQSALTRARQARRKTRARSGGGHRVSRTAHCGCSAFSRDLQEIRVLRKPPIRAELYLGNPKNNLGQQLKYADKRGSPFAIIQGPDEKQREEVTIKDLILGAGLTDIKDRDEYLKKQAEAQFAVKEEQLVAEVRKLLARHKLG